MYRRIENDGSLITASANGAKPGLLTEIEVCHKEVGLLHEVIDLLRERLEVVCEPVLPQVEKAPSNQASPPVEIAPALAELGRLRNRISSLNATVQMLLQRLSL